MRKKEAMRKIAHMKNIPCSLSHPHTYKHRIPIHGSLFLLRLLTPLTDSIVYPTETYDFESHRVAVVLTPFNGFNTLKVSKLITS